MKLEVGMFIRTKWGIAKIIDIICGEDLVFDNDNIFDENEKEIYKYNRPSMYGNWANSDITKASHNIIDLIEVGDYVNGYPVYEIIEYEDNTRAIVIADDNKSIIWEESSQYIKSIVTKEQFESISYKVGE